jgi:hypothetical protein
MSLAREQPAWVGVGQTDKAEHDLGGNRHACFAIGPSAERDSQGLGQEGTTAFAIVSIRISRMRAAIEWRVLVAGNGFIEIYPCSCKYGVVSSTCLACFSESFTIGLCYGGDRQM